VGVVDGCRFETQRLRVAPWHEDLGDDELSAFVADLLTPAVTAALPSDWQGPYDVRRARAWVADRDHESTVLIARAGTTAVGVLIIAHVHTHSERHLRLGYLLVEQQWGRGLAGELVGGFVDWCRSRHSIRSLTAGVEPGNDASRRVLAGNGFESVGDDGDDAETLRVHLECDAAVVIRPEETADVERIRAVVASAFGSDVEADLVDRIRASPEFVPELSLVAEVDGEVVGHVMISDAVVRHATGEREIVMLSPLSVAPDRQRQGIGAALVTTALDRTERFHEPLVVLEGDPRYYGRFGFEHAAEHGLTIPLPDWAPSEAGQVARLGAYDPNDPSLQGTVVYPPAFDGLE